jgi:anti-sigma factor RsiW
VSKELSCQESVELVTDYIEDSLPTEERRRFEHHLSYCPGCGTYVEQIRETVRITGRVSREETLPPALREELLSQFRSWKESGQ